jgi:hypothetical protein
MCSFIPVMVLSSGMYCVFLMLARALFGMEFFRFNRSDQVAALFCATHKTVAMGIPLLKVCSSLTHGRLFFLLLIFLPIFTGDLQREPQFGSDLCASAHLSPEYAFVPACDLRVSSSCICPCAAQLLVGSLLIPRIIRWMAKDPLRVEHTPIVTDAPAGATSLDPALPTAGSAVASAAEDGPTTPTSGSPRKPAAEDSVAVSIYDRGSGAGFGGSSGNLHATPSQPSVQAP